LAKCSRNTSFMVKRCKRNRWWNDSRTVGFNNSNWFILLVICLRSLWIQWSYFYTFMIQIVKNCNLHVVLQNLVDRLTEEMV